MISENVPKVKQLWQMFNFWYLWGWGSSGGLLRERSQAAQWERQIREKAPYHDSIKGKRDEYGQRWTVRIPVEGKNGRTVTVETGWIVRPEKLEPELTTAFVMKEKKNA